MRAGVKLKHIFPSRQSGGLWVLSGEGHVVAQGLGVPPQESPHSDCRAPGSAQACSRRTLAMPRLRGLPIGPLQATTPDWKSLGICCPLVLAGFKHELEGMGGESAPRPPPAQQSCQDIPPSPDRETEARRGSGACPSSHRK